jgi:UPF0755 protein
MKRKLSFLIVLILLAVGGFFSWWVTAISPVDVSNKTPQLFVIKPGEGIREIANNLKEQGLIRNTVAFFLIVKQKGLDNKIQAGDFRLTKNMNTQTIAESLTHGSLDVWVTFPEGVRAQEIADILQDNIGTFEESWRIRLEEHEGYLFPDSYLIPTDATIDQVLTILLNNFEKKYETVNGVRQNQYTKEELVIIASMVEREARHAEDRPLVASVIFNRLEVGMGLNIDATIQYALGYQAQEKRWWKRSLTADDIRFRSDYNTYIHAGLPPTPISNPGVEVLQAVASAPETAYLYYVSDSQGNNHYARTLAEHNANVAKYIR